MSTRSVIAYGTGLDDFKGVYCHSDGYPSGVGQQLYELYRSKYFDKNIEKMCKEIIDDKPLGGWSCMGTFPPMGYDEKEPLIREWYNAPRDTPYPEGAVYYDGSRAYDTEFFYTPDQDNVVFDWGCDYLYIINKETHVMSIYDLPYGNKPELLGVVNLDGPEPGWDFEEGEEE